MKTNLVAPGALVSLKAFTKTHNEQEINQSLLEETRGATETIGFS